MLTIKSLPATFIHPLFKNPHRPKFIHKKEDAKLALMPQGRAQPLRHARHLNDIQFCILCDHSVITIWNIEKDTLSHQGAVGFLQRLTEWL